LIAWEPALLRWSPYDTLQTILIADSLNFIVEARDQFNRELQYQFWMGDSLIANRDSIWLQFNSLGETDVQARVIAEDYTTSITWHVTVTDLYISSHTPDTTSLTLRRGSTVDFSIDTVRTIFPLNEVEYFWRVSRDGEALPDAGAEPRATVEFLRSGHYTVEGLAYRGEASDAVVWDVAVSGAIWAFQPEATALTVVQDSSVEFMVLPSVSDSVNRFEWFLDGEIQADARDSVHSVHFVHLGDHTVTAILSDTLESDTVVWSVSVVAPTSVGKDGLEARPTGIRAAHEQIRSRTAAVREPHPGHRHLVALAARQLSDPRQFYERAAPLVGLRHHRAPQ